MRAFYFFILTTALLLCFSSRRQAFERKEKLSDYGFFRGDLKELMPVADVVPYAVNTPLFSNYAEKLRFIRLPKGAAASYNDSTVFEFPLETIVIKNFYYPKDVRNPAKGRIILETRLLVLESTGWQAYPYIWNKEQTEAYYDPAGETMKITYVNRSGRKVETPYVIPNRNQCKGCHANKSRLMPIGLNARQLNGNFPYPNGIENQLFYWKRLGLLNDVSPQPPSLSVWDNPSSGSLNDRARAYLDANCGHCHSRNGAANTSGLYLDIFENDPGHLGVNKAPVAAGRGAGSLKFDIVPGEPHNSILVFRMRTNDPAIAMPEIGREQIHQEGVALIEEWIRKNTFTSN